MYFIIAVKHLAIRPTLLQLREVWVDLLSKTSRRDGKMSLDAFMWLNKVTLDIIGLTGNSPLAALFAVPVPDCVFRIMRRI